MKTKKPPQTTDSVPTTFVSKVHELWDRLIIDVEDKIASGDVNTTLLREFAGIMRAAAALDAEQRAQQRADDREAVGLPEARVIRHLTLLSDHEWSHVKQLVDAGRLGKKGSVLA